MSGDPLTPEERDYFSKANDHDRLMKLSQAVWGPKIGLADHVTQNSSILLGDGTKENPGLVSAFYEHVRQQEENEHRRNRNLQILIGLSYIFVVVLDRILSIFFH